MAYIIVRIRGTVNIRGDVTETLGYLSLTRANHAVVIPQTPSYKGMLQKVKDYVTWGEAAPETLERLIGSRGRLAGDAPVTDEYLKGHSEFASIGELAKALAGDKGSYKDLEGIKPLFRLSPPRKGYRAVKRAYNAGGDLGYRGQAINELVERMID